MPFASLSSLFLRALSVAGAVPRGGSQAGEATALYLAAQEGHAPVVTRLIAARCDLNSLDVRSRPTSPACALPS